MIVLRALRVAGLGRFNDPVALEGFGSRLNVLSGPNELGKSTLLRVLELVLTARYASDTDAIKRLASNNRGTPVIEADFEAEGHLWRIQKRFLHGATAVLQDLTAGNEFKKAGAETRLASLLEGPPDLKNRFGMLWVKQDDGLKPVAPETIGGGLSALIMSEVDAVALDGPARTLHKTITSMLESLQQPKNRKPRATGAWATAVKANDEAIKRLAAAEARATEQASRLEKLSANTTERRMLLAPETVQRRSEQLMTARNRYTKALHVAQQRREAAQTLSLALVTLQSAEQAHRALCADIDTAAKLHAESMIDRATLADFAQRQIACAAELDAVRTIFDRETSASVALETSLEAARTAARANEAALERDRIAARISNVRAALTARDQARSEASAFAQVSASSVKALGTAITNLANLEGALSAVVPEVAITLAADGAGRIVLDGEPLTRSITLNPAEPVTLDIVGVGRIVIAPNPATVSAAQRETRERIRAEIAATFAAVGVTTFAAAENALAAKLAAEVKARDAEILLQALAPDGIDALIASHAELSARSLLASEKAVTTSIEELQTALNAHRSARDAASENINRLQIAHSRICEEAARFDATAAGRLEHLAALKNKLGDASAQQLAQAATAAKLDAARTQFSNAKSAVDAWEAQSDADRLDTLAVEVAAAEAAVASVDERRIILDQMIFGLESELRVASDEDVETELEIARAAQSTAAARHADVDAEVKALNLLDREFRAIADAGRREWSGPILQRIEPYLLRVFPNAALQLDEKLIPAHLLREGRSEPHEQLSRGTQEQIAILVRLGLARLLADRGHAVPMILDDALVYADDHRIGQMFKALEDAAQVHQVIVLNCREQTYASLARAPDAKVLSFTTWHLSAMAA